MNTISFPGLGIGEFTIKNSFTIFGFEFHFYSIIIALGMLLAVAYAFWRFKENKIKLDIVLDYAVWVLPMSIVGARLYFVLFDMLAPQGGGSYFDNIIRWKGEEITLDFFGGAHVAMLYDIVSVWNGGLAIYGGVIAGGIAIALVASFKKMNTFKILDIAVPAVLFAQVLGRWGNFFNAEAYGEVTSLPWGMSINGEAPVHPTFLYESLWNIVGVILMIGTLIVATKILKVPENRHIDGFFFSFYMIWYGAGRMWIEGLRTDSLWLIPGVIRVSIFVAIVTLIAGLLLMAFIVTRRIILVKKNIDIWEKFQSKINKNKKTEVQNGTNN